MTNKKQIAPVQGKEIIDVVQNKVRAMMSKKEINFPKNYSPENALKAFWLKLQTVKDRNKQPALKVCTNTSIINSMLYMVVMGLTPAKDQGYQIVYGNELSFQPSYFGWLAVFKRILGTNEIDAQVVYKDDVFEYEIVDGRKHVTKHVQKFDNIKNENIIGAYATIIYPDGKKKSEIMTISEIEEAWKQSKNFPFDQEGNLKPDSTHARFKQEMCKKTVLIRATKVDIKTSADSDIMAEAVQKTIEAEYVFDDDPVKEIEDKANTQDFVPQDEPEEEIPEEKPKPKTKPKSKPKKEVSEKEVEAKADQKDIDTLDGLFEYLIEKGVEVNKLYGDMIDRYETQMMNELTATQVEEYIKILRGYQKKVNEGKEVFEE